MGLFNKISSAIQDGKDRAAQEKAAFADRIKYMNLTDACQFAVKKFDSASLPMKVSIVPILKKRIQDEDSDNELYRAFECMYNFAKHKRNTTALNVSQWIGQKLDQNGDRRVERKEHDDGKVIFVPSNPYSYY